MTFKDKCLEASVNYSTAITYRKKHSNLTDEQVIEELLAKKNRITAAEKCRQAGVDYNKVCYYKHDHPELSYDEIIERYKQGIKEESFAEKCRKAGLTEQGYINALSYRKTHRNLSDEHIISMYKDLDKYGTLESLCETQGVRYSTACQYRKEHPELLNSEIVKILKAKKENSITFKEKCRQANVSYDKACKLRIKTDLTDEEIIDTLLTEVKEPSLQELCRVKCANYNTASRIRRQNRNLTLNEVVEKALEDKPLTFKEKCEQSGVSYRTGKYYKQQHKDLTDEEIIDKVRNLHKNKNRDELWTLCKKWRVNYKKASYARDKHILTNEQAVVYIGNNLAINMLGEIVEV